VGYTDGFLDGLRQAGDPSTDDIIKQLARTEQIRTVSDVLLDTDLQRPTGAGRAAAVDRTLARTARRPA
jgi:hypothetical protein